MKQHQTLHSALGDDSLVIQYQTVGQYRSALLAAFPQRVAPVAQIQQTAAFRDVLAERQRQQDDENWTPENDDDHRDGQMATAAGYYALACGFPHERDLGRGVVPAYWPWTRDWWKPKTKRSNLLRAGALILAEIERIDRAAAQAQPQQPARTELQTQLANLGQGAS